MTSVNGVRDFVRRSAGLLAASAACLAGSADTQAAAPAYPDILPLRQVKPGMVGYGLTTFKGTTISKFQVTVVGILRKENAGHDLILIRMKGGPITERGANLIQGMSGSPIYLNGKVAGAFSMGEAFPKEPVGMVTPIEDMLDAWDPAIPQRPEYFQPAEPNAAPQPASWQTDTRQRTVRLPTPIRINGRLVRSIVLNARGPIRKSTAATARLYRATSLLAVPGISARNRAWLQKELDAQGVAVTVAQGPIIGGGRHPAFKGVPLRPGSAFGTFLATGDIQVGGTGTITYRRGNRVLGFGHPFFSLGPVDAAITSAYIVDIFSGLQVSHHIAVAGPVIGTLLQDRDFSVSGEIGRMPHLVPFTVTVNDETTHRTKTFHVAMFQHPTFTPSLMRLAAREAITRVHGLPGAVMANVETSVEAAEVGTVTRRNVVFDSDDIASAAVGDLNDITSIVSGNPFYPLPIKRGSLNIQISAGHNTATVERIFTRIGRFEPGDKMDIGVILKPYRRDAITRSLTLTIPTDTPTGKYQLMVRGGSPTMTRIGPFILSGGGAADPQTPPVNVRQMIARLAKHEANTDIVGRLILNSVAPALEGEKLSQLPPNLASLMRSERNSGVRLERDEVRVVEPTDYVVSGTQQLIISIVKKNTQEPAGTTGTAPTSGPMPSGLIGIMPTLPPGLTGTSAGDESADDGAGSILHLDRLQPGAAMLKAPEAPKDAKPAKQSKPKPAAPATGEKTTAPAAPAAAAGIATPATQVPDGAADKPVGRQLQIWRQSAKSNFASGRFSGSGVTPNGDLRLSPALRPFASTSETYIWALVAAPDGTLYAGTGTGGRILKIDTAGKVSVFATLPVISVQSLLLARDGSLWAGSGVRGALFHIKPGGQFTEVAQLPEKYVLALAQNSKGDLFAAPGGGGTIYRISAADAAAEIKDSAKPWAKTAAAHVMALTMGPSDAVYAGTGPEGLVYKFDADGKQSVLFDAREASITALAVDAGGTIFAGTGPKGVLYRIAPDGTATVIYDKATSFFTALRLLPDGTLYATSVNAAYRIADAVSDGQPTVLPLDNPRDIDLLSLALLPGGGIAAGTGNVGEIYAARTDPGQAEGSYESPVHDAHVISRWATARWDATVPAGANVMIDTRSGSTAEPDATWSEWAHVRPTDTDSGAIVSPPARFIQFRTRMSAPASRAAALTLREVAIAYLPRNQAPRVVIQLPAGGEKLAKTQTFRWVGSDPDSDTLSYLAEISADHGATWKPLPAAKGAAAGKPVRETSRTVDTSLIPDGLYRLRVTASDAPSNPEGSFSAAATSETFTVVNAKPQIVITSQAVAPADKRIAIAGTVSQSLISVTGVQYRVDGGEWTSAAPEAGLFDSGQVRFSLHTEPLAAGKHTVEVEAFNAAGNHAVEKVTIDVS